MIETVPPGTILHGHYRIERVLGSGGFGHVYLAIDLANSLQCAVKEYLVSGASGQEQLKHEATVLSQLNHPSLPAFQNAFMERGRYYVVLNYIEGNDLTDIIRMTRQRNDVIPIERVLSWILSICDAVLFLHMQQPPVIHRDIKPDNIRITSNGTAILVDLGNAKAAADGARTLFFIRHQGTPGYAPQEQYPGGSGTDIRSDVYALGGTLYYALIAHEPPSVSTRNQAIQQGLPDLPTLQENLAKNPPPENTEPPKAQFRMGSGRSGKPAPRHSRHLAQLGTLPPDLLKQLNKVIQRAMAMKPKDRYQTVADFANDLKKVAQAMPAAPPQIQVDGHPVDPHSTQPDLPMLYEAIQTAKEQAEQRDARQASSPSQPPVVVQPTYCPRCNSVVSSQATYCPRCGNVLHPASGSNPGSPQKAVDIGEQTMIVKPQSMAQQVSDAQKARIQNNPQATHRAQPANSQFSSSTPRGQVSLATHTPPPQQAQVQQAIQSVTGNGKQGSWFTIGPRAIVVLLVIVLLLVAFGIFLFVQQGLH